MCLCVCVYKEILIVLKRSANKKLVLLSQTLFEAFTEI